MALNPSPNYPPIGEGPYKIDRQWCMGDSLPFINENFRIFDDRILTLSSTFVKEVSAGSNITITPTASSNIIAISNTIAPCVLQVQYYRNSSTTTTTTNAIGDSNSAPTTSTGVEILTKTITPKRNNSLVKVSVVVTAANTFFEGGAAIALFKDSSSNAIATTASTGYYQNNISLVYYDTVSSLSTITYKVRLYCHKAGGTLWLNRTGSGAGYTQGGTNVSYLTLEEISQ